MWRRGENREGVDLVAACEAFLSGRYVAYSEVKHRDVPAWAWTNLLAHGRLNDLEDARRVLVNGHHRYVVNCDWHAAQSYLAGEVLLRAGDEEDTLREFQSRVLVPLELRLAAIGHTRYLNPVDLAAIVLDALDRDRYRRRRCSGTEVVRSDPPS